MAFLGYLRPKKRNGQFDCQTIKRDVSKLPSMAKGHTHSTNFALLKNITLWRFLAVAFMLFCCQSPLCFANSDEHVPPCEIDLIDVYRHVRLLQPLQAVQWTFRKRVKRQISITGRVASVDWNTITLVTLGQDDELYFIKFHRHELESNMVQWLTPYGIPDLDHTILKQPQFSAFDRNALVLKIKSEHKQLEIQQEALKREESRRRQREIDNQKLLTKEDLPQTSAIIGLQPLTHDQAEKTHSSAYRSLPLADVLVNLSPEQDVKVQFTDSAGSFNSLVGRVVTLAPFVLKVGIYKNKKLVVWGLVALDGTKIKYAQPLTLAPPHITKGQTLHLFFSESVKGLRRLSGKVLEVDARNGLLIEGVDAQGIPRRWRLAQEELDLAININSP